MPCAEQLARAAPGPRADVALGHRLIRSGQAGRVTHLGVGPGVRAADRQVEQDRGRHDGDARGAGLDADAALGQVTHDPIGRGQPERAPARQHHAVNLLHQVHRPQQVGLTRAGRAAALIDAADRPGFTQHHRAARQTDRVGRVPDFDAGNGSEGVVGSHQSDPFGCNACCVIRDP